MTVPIPQISTDIHSHKMEVIKTDIEGVVIIEPRIFADSRGYFSKAIQRKNSMKKCALWILCRIMKAAHPTE